MPSPEQTVTTLSTKGQVILPKGLRDRRQWSPGTRLIVEDTPEGVLLRQAPAFQPTDTASVFGRLRHEGPPVSIEDMDAALRDEAGRRR